MHRPTLQKLQSAQLDILIVGGGIVGCGIARDAALRGLRVGLVEREDFGSGTTSRSTRLIHGGLRYLEIFDFGLVRDDMREREILLRIAPHLVRPIPFLVPMYRWRAWQRDRLRAGMVLYDLLSYDKSLPWHQFLSRSETLRVEPRLNPSGLQGAARYFDCQVEFPERLALANAVDAAEHGALMRNHTAIESFIEEGGRVAGVRARDMGTGRRATIRARLTINATGPWLDQALGKLEVGHAPLLRTTKGAHLVVPSISENAILLVAHADKRVFFVVPWFGYSLVGTTDTDFQKDPSDARADLADVSYLLRETAAAFPAAAGMAVHYGMAGVRALVRKDGVHASEVSRKHAIRDHAQHGGPEGLVSVLGGKITAYRDIAQEATELASKRLGHRARSTTALATLPGGETAPEQVFANLWSRAEELGVSEAQTWHLVAQYGTRLSRVLALAEHQPSLAAPLCSHGPTIAAQAVYATRKEGAITLADVLLRRAPGGLASCQALDCLDQVAETIGAELGWDSTRRDAEVEAYRALVSEQYAAPVSAGPRSLTA